MIIFRYLSKNLLVTMSAVTLILLLIILSGRFIKYLAQAAAGELAADVLFSILGFRMPGFLAQILPLGLFLGVLLSYGRLYLDSEMTVLRACGMSTRRLVFYTLIPSFLVAALVAVLSLWVAPWGAARTDEIFRAQDARTEFDALSPGRFQQLGTGERVTYSERLSRDRKLMYQVFIAETDLGAQRGQERPVLTLAESASQYVDPQTGSRFLSLRDGYRYEGTPGKADYRMIQYEQYDIKVPAPKQSTRQARIEAKATAALWGSSALEDIAELQWRISLVLLVPIISLIAVPLSRVDPRQGRFFKLLPAIFLYLLYLFVLSSLKTRIEEGRLPPALGLWWVHVLFLAVALGLVAGWQQKVLTWAEQGRNRWRRGMPGSGGQA